MPPPWPVLHSLYLFATLLSHLPPPPTLPPLLSLLSTLSSLPTILSLRPSPPRLSLLAIFLVSLSALLSALLRLLSALSTLLHPAPLPRPALLPLFPPLLILLPLRRDPALRILRSVAPVALRLLLPPLPARPAAARRPPPAPALLAVLLHAATAALFAFADLLARVLAPRFAALAAALAALLCAALALPFLRLALRVLVQGAPERVAAAVRRSVDQLAAVHGVVRCQNVRVWEETLGVFVATVSVVVAEQVDGRAVLEKAEAIFDGVVHDLTVQVETVAKEGKGAC